MTEDYTSFRDDLFRTCGVFTWNFNIDKGSFVKVMRILGASAAFVNGDNDHNLSYVQNLFSRCYADMENHSGFVDRIGEAGRYSKDFAMHVWYTWGVIGGTARALDIEAKPDSDQFFFKFIKSMNLDHDQAMDAFRRGSFLGHDLVYFGRLFSDSLPESTKAVGNDRFPDEEMLFQQTLDMHLSMGMSEGEAREMATDMLQRAKEQCIADGFTTKPPNGDEALELEKTDERMKAAFRMLRDEGVTDEDIRWWWNMPDLERALVQETDKTAKSATWLRWIESGLTPNEASERTNKIHPRFGDPSSEAGEGRPLPIELKLRITEFCEKWRMKPVAFKEKIEKYANFNALVRAAIRAGKL